MRATDHRDNRTRKKWTDPSSSSRLCLFAAYISPHPLSERNCVYESIAKGHSLCKSYVAFPGSSFSGFSRFVVVRGAQCLALAAADRDG